MKAFVDIDVIQVQPERSPIKRGLRELKVCRGIDQISSKRTVYHGHDLIIEIAHHDNRIADRFVEQDFIAE